MKFKKALTRSHFYSSNADKMEAVYVNFNFNRGPRILIITGRNVIPKITSNFEIFSAHNLLKK